jgi:hypothetical protein
MRQPPVVAGDRTIIRGAATYREQQACATASPPRPTGGGCGHWIMVCGPGWSLPFASATATPGARRCRWPLIVAIHVVVDPAESKALLVSCVGR